MVALVPLQVSLKETTATQRALESQLLSSKNNDSSRDFKIKEMEGRMRALEKENEMLRQKVTHHLSRPHHVCVEISVIRSLEALWSSELSKVWQSLDDAGVRTHAETV